MKYTPKTFVWFCAMNECPFLGVSSNRRQTLKIALFYKKGGALSAGKTAEVGVRTPCTPWIRQCRDLIPIDSVWRIYLLSIMFVSMALVIHREEQKTR
jgi:hypothetical protein